MSSSKSSPKRTGKISFKFGEVSAFDLFYQLTYMSAMASAGLSRSKTFEIAARSRSTAAEYFVAINTLVDEMRYDYPEACHRVGEKAKSEDMKSFLLRLSDALRSGEPLADFLAREAEVQGDNYGNAYERDVESLKQWTDAFSSMLVSAAVIVIIQVVSALIYPMKMGVMAGLMTAGVIMGFFGAWIISRAAPKEITTVASAEGSPEQRRALTLFKITAPATVLICLLLILLGVHLGWVLIVIAVLALPIGIVGLLSDRKTKKKDEEFSTFLRSAGGMASSSGTTLKVALTKIDLSSFPTLEPDIARLSTRLQALVDPELCWHKFRMETGSRLISEATSILYSAVKMGGDPERVGYLCSLFVSKTSQLRAKRRLVSSTFTALTLVMQGVMSGLMIFVLEIVNNFVRMMEEVLTSEDLQLASESTDVSMSMINFTPQQLQYLSTMTLAMVILLAVISAVAILAGDGGYKFKFSFYLSVALFISGVSLLVVPPIVAKLLVV
jgi:flagellar protein FlaJ